MRSRVTLALALLAAALAAGCGEENSRALIAEADAQALLESVDRIESACADEDVSAARAAADDAAAQINELPRRVDDSLQSNLRAWIDHIQGRIDRDCKAAEEETPTPTETPSADRDADAHRDPRADGDPDGDARADRDAGADRDADR